MIAENKQRFIDPYLRVITAVGAVILLFSACRLPAAILDTRFLVLDRFSLDCMDGYKSSFYHEAIF